MQQQQSVNLLPPSLPKGGGAIQGMGESLNGVGPDGMASLSIPLPLSAGRGVVPALTLNYSSGAGNGAFGMGWQVGNLAIRRRTQHGVPKYDAQDAFLSPGGEILVTALNVDGQPDIRQRTSLLGATLSSSHTVTRYQPQLTEDHSRLEYWQPARTETAQPFWVMYTPDGSVHLMGKTHQARISDPKNDSHIAQWLLEESITPTGEHVYYQYRAEDSVSCDTTEQQQHPQAVDAQRYLSQVSYGNLIPGTVPLVLGTLPVPADSWLFHAVFDYGERSAAQADEPAYTAAGEWSCRPDCFSYYAFGFELRTRRLCRQVLMFHRIDLLQGVPTAQQAPTLVTRMIMDYDLQETLSTLVAVRQLGHEPDGTVSTLPPLEFDYSRLPSPLSTQWSPMPVLNNLNDHQPYQLVDLLGEGLPGVLYQDQGVWWYRAPERLAGDAPDAITWAVAAPLPVIPSLQQSAFLIDLDGDGQLDWVVTQPGVAGHYSLQPDGHWTGFIPLTALPVEFFHPNAQLADLTGDGLADLAMIGPKSVRLYPNTRSGFTAALEVEQADGILLPTPSPQRLVAFSDLLGSGQQHLVAIAADGVTCWPHLGYGRFGSPLTLPGFSQPIEEFNPDQVYLVDMDGSGIVSIVYAQPTHLLLYPNEGGNHFGTPYTLPLPDGVFFDNTCQLQAADIEGIGVPSLVLTVPHMAPAHWRYDFSREKPWLLNAMNNNMGADTVLRYRSSAQFWLDEKAEQQAQGIKPVCHLPFPIHTLWQTESWDEITGNRLLSTVCYAQGYWDGREREFRGFGYVETCDTDERATGSAPERTVPTLTKTWFATGNPDIDDAQSREFWSGDTQAFPSYRPRFSVWEHDRDAPITSGNQDEQYWMQRGLKGMPVRIELYGLDDGEIGKIPYSVSESRYQVRLCPSAPSAPVVQVSEIESRTYTYERISSDPVCTQTVLLEQDVYGAPLRSVSVSYPRRPYSATHSYPMSLPPTAVDSSYDDQQQVLRLVQKQSRWYHLSTDDALVIGIPDCQRGDTFESPGQNVPAGGITLETLQDRDGLLAADKSQVYLGQQRTAYTDGSAPELPSPAIPVLVAYTESATLDEATLNAFSGVMSEADLQKMLTQGGYINVPRLFEEGGSDAVWCARRGYTDYGDAAQFWRPVAVRDTALTGKTRYFWDACYCAVTRMEDAAGLKTQATYDYRFITPVHLIDANGNESQAALDALGRMTSMRFWGTEADERSGYSTPAEKPFTAPQTVDTALGLLPGLPVAKSLTYVPDSWMPVAPRSISSTELIRLQEARVLTEDGAVCALALRRAQARRLPCTEHLARAEAPHRQPPHLCVISTDRYDNDPAQQQRQQIMFADGFGRPLQASVRQVAGPAYCRDEQGALQTSPDGTPTEVQTDVRWAVTGRTEYNNKGWPVRTYQPYFLNDWRYVNDDSTRTDLYADTAGYDALGRVTQIVTALGYVKRTQTYPWFAVSEDENDNAAV